jgi:hypothetical protein
MESISFRPANVVRFTGVRKAASPRREQGDFLDAVYAAGSLPVAADDRIAKAMAARLTIFGFVMIDEMLSDGSARRLRPSEADPHPRAATGLTIPRGLLRRP